MALDYAQLERVGLLVDAASGALFMLLSLLIFLRVRGGDANATRRLRVFVAFGLAWGLNLFARNLADVLDPLPIRSFLDLVGMGSALLLLPFLVALALGFPSPLAPDERPRVALLGLVVLAVEGTRIALLASTSAWTLSQTLYATQVAVDKFGLLLFLGTLALRAMGRAPPAARDVMLGTLAFAPYLGLNGGVMLSRAAIRLDPVMSLALVLQALAVMGLAVLWLRVTLVARDAELRRTARTAAILLPALVLAGILFGSWTDPEYADDLGVLGLARVFGLLVLAYGIVRHQLLGIDVRLRWTVSKSTVAAVFIAVFFLASEAAQQFFGETLGSTYVGIAAAGGLVFILAPLQRAAERLAERAVPLPAEPAAALAPVLAKGAEHEAVYRDALHLALRGGRLTREEETKLHRLAEALRIRPGRAHEMLAEAERDAAGDERPDAA